MLQSPAKFHKARADRTDSTGEIWKSSAYAAYDCFTFSLLLFFLSYFWTALRVGRGAYVMGNPAGFPYDTNSQMRSVHLHLLLVCCLHFLRPLPNPNLPSALLFAKYIRKFFHSLIPPPQSTSFVCIWDWSSSLWPDYYNMLIELTRVR